MNRMHAIWTVALGCALAVFAPVAHAVTRTLVVDDATGTVLCRDGDCAARVSPCSTFKIPLALMAADAGIITGPHAPRLPYLPHYSAVMPAHQADTDPTSWMLNSVVWYSQQLTPRLGEAAFARYVVLFAYGNQDVSGDAGQHNGLTQAWLGSSLLISPDEQVAFLRKVLGHQLPLKPQAGVLLEQIVPVYPAAGGWTVHGKSGSGFRRDAAENTAPPRKLGWFVGWAEKDGRRLVFARLILDETEIAAWGGVRARESLLQDLSRLAAGKQ